MVGIPHETGSPRRTVDEIVSVEKVPSWSIVRPMTSSAPRKSCANGKFLPASCAEDDAKAAVAPISMADRFEDCMRGMIQ